MRPSPHRGSISHQQGADADADAAAVDVDEDGSRTMRRMADGSSLSP